MEATNRMLTKRYNFKDLYKAGLRVGDIVAYKSNKSEKGQCWDYVLLGDGFPEEFNAELVCYGTPTDIEKYYFSMIGFHWVGSVDNFEFRIPTEHEKKKFVDACVETLTNVPEFTIFDVNDYEQILCALLSRKLLSYYDAVKLEYKLTKIHGKNILRGSKYWNK